VNFGWLSDIPWPHFQACFFATTIPGYPSEQKQRQPSQRIDEGQAVHIQTDLSEKHVPIFSPGVLLVFGSVTVFIHLDEIVVAVGKVVDEARDEKQSHG